jgi:hypothetical protein
MVRGGRNADGLYASDTRNRVATTIHLMYQDNIFSTAQLTLVEGNRQTQQIQNLPPLWAWEFDPPESI